jgi:LuxR family maltose regulon positive regulatory protein
VDVKKETQVVNRIAWLSLDEGDNDLVRFLTYFIAALNRAEGADAGLGDGVLSMLQSPQPPPKEVVLTPLINEIATIPDRIILVLDDYHIIESSQVDDALTFLLEHFPPQMHMVIATREDPHLPLSRLRAGGQMTELRTTDLRFSSSEAGEFLNKVMGLNLSTENIAALESRTEGWIAGLQLAAISLQGHKDTASLIKSFTGSHRFVLDYLIEEVLDQQSESVQNFLLQTAVLDRMTGSLCDALTEQDNSQATLEMLERGNLFIVPLDGERQWYRYHHLFADLLRQRLRQTHLEQIPTLHSRASEWYEQNGFTEEAIEHSLRAKDFERAAGLAELAWQAMDSSFQSAAWLGWVKKLPDELIRTRPVLSIQYAWALIDGGELEASEARLRDAERWLDPTGDMSARPEAPADEMVVVDEEQFRTLPARIAIARAVNAQAQGDFPGTVKYAELALKLTSEEDHLGRAQATVTLGFTYWASGDLEAAHRAMADWINSMQKAGNIVFAIASTFALADIMVAQGRLHEAVRAYKGSLHA